MPDRRQDLDLKRDISRLGFSAINVNSVIGAGIFGLPAVVAARAGDFSPWMFFLGGALILTVVLSFARAASLVRETGGMIVYASHAFGPFVGFQTGWLGYVSRMVAMGANTNLLVTYASWFWTPLADDPWRALALTVLIGGMTMLSARGIRHSMTAVFALTAMKLLPLTLLILYGLGRVDLGMLMGASPPPLDGMGETILILLYAFVGFEGTTVTAGEGKQPRRDLPRALIQTIVLIGMLYFLVQVVSMATLPDLGERDAALTAVAEALAGWWGAVIMTLGAVFSIAGNLMSSVLSAPRMSYAMALEGSMPGWFARVHPRFRTPYNSVLFYGAVCLLMALTGSFVWLAAMSTLVRLITYMVCIAALPRLSTRTEATERAFRLPGGLLIPGIAMLLCLWLVTFASLRSWLTTAAFFLVGCGLYFHSRRRREA